jgi:hypothetical protein
MGEREVALRREEPRNWWRTAALFVAIVGSLAAGAWVVYALDDQGRHVGNFVTLPPQSGYTVDVPEAGTYTLWGSAISGGYVETPAVEDMHELLLVGFDGPVDSDDPVRVDTVPFDGHVTYRVDGTRYGVAVWTVEFPEAGTYEVERRNSGVGGVSLALGKGIGMPSRITSGLFAIAGITIVLAVGLMAVAWAVDRRRINEMLSGFDSFGRSDSTPS